MLGVRHLSRGAACLGSRLARAAVMHPSSWSEPHRFLRMERRSLYVSRSAMGQEKNVASGLSGSQPADAVTVTACVPQPDTGMLKVMWSAGSEDMYPYVWLRDNCQCPVCFHEPSVSRLVMLRDLHGDVKPTNVMMSDGGRDIQVQWSDGHVGRYSTGWLHERIFGAHQESSSNQYRLKQEPLGHEVPRISFPEVLRDDAALLAFLEALEVTGVVVLCDVPRQKGQIHTLTKRIGHLKVTHYGEIFHVYNKIDSNNLAYTASSLDLHGDQPYLESKPQIQLLHCISQFPGEGGETLLADAFAAASQLRASNPAHFRTLTNTIVRFRDIGVEGGAKYHAITETPTIKLDVNGNIQDVNFNQMVRDSHFHVTPETAMAWYKATLALRDILYCPDSIVQFKMNAGDMTVFDNCRILHGRLGYRADKGERFLEGAYWDWDWVRARRRILHQETML